MTLLAIENLTVALAGRNVLEDVTLTVAPGECVGLVGESGSGKSLTTLAAIGMLPSTAGVVGGSVLTCGTDVLHAPERSLREIRGRRAALIFQDPMQALMPIRRVGKQIEDVLAAHLKVRGAAAKSIGLRLFAAMGLFDPERVWRAMPFQLSGGQRQRALIAIALCVEPSLVLADEVTTALDADARADVLGLLANHVRRGGGGALIVSHDLGMVRGACDRIYVMRNGRVVESGTAAQVIDRPTHAYTRMLLAALPDRSPPKTPLPVDEA